ncbi:MAG: beta-propeller fold lactonase family protein [Acidobacteriia bacterium]|nr:beta-propeller fold lactonase family protein [Terriglobia bacterium]
MNGFSRFRILLTLAGMVFLTTILSAQTNFIYVNNDIAGPNSVSAFSVQSNGSLLPLPGSPFATGGTGQGIGFFATNLIVISSTGNFLFASNGGNHTVSAFAVNSGTGQLTTVPGSPFVAGVGSGLGLSLAVSPNGQFLFAGDDGSAYVAVFTIAGNGALSQIPGSPFETDASDIDGMAVSPNGKLLAFADPNGAIDIFSIAASGALLAVPGSPFETDLGRPTGLAFNNTGTVLYVGNFNVEDTEIEVFSVAANGFLAPISGSPFSFASGRNSNIVLPSPDNRFLFVSNLLSNTITVLALSPGGTPTLLPGSPFGTGMNLLTEAVATDPLGNFLFVTGFSGEIDDPVSVFKIASNGTLTLVPGSPFSNSPGQIRTGITDSLPTPEFSICVADSSGNRLLFDPIRGFFELQNCNSGLTAFGQGRSFSEGCNIFFFEPLPNGFVKGAINTCGQQGTGVFDGIPTGSGVVSVHGTILPITSCSCPLPNPS